MKCMAGIIHAQQQAAMMYKLTLLALASVRIVASLPENTPDMLFCDKSSCLSSVKANHDDGSVPADQQQQVYLMQKASWCGRGSDVFVCTVPQATSR